MNSGSSIFGEGINKAYLLRGTKISVLADLSISVSAGEAVAIMGRSGAGKSTLLNVLGGLDRPDAGSLTIGVSNVFALSNHGRARFRARNIGFIFQSFNLLQEMTVLENVLLPGLAAHEVKEPKELRDRAELLLREVGLADRLDHRPLELSGGEQQRVSIARALMNDPHVLLADEPTGNLDERTAGQVLDLLFGLSQSRGRTLVIVTHNTATAARCKRTLQLENGRLNVVNG